MTRDEAYINMAIEVLKRIEADGCVGCKFEHIEEWEMPCKKCRRNCKDYWRTKEEDNDGEVH